MSDGARTPAENDKVLAKAQELGFDVVCGTSKTLLLDLDAGRELNVDVYQLICEKYGTPEMTCWKSKSGKGTHVMLRFNHNKVFLNNAVATALECALGSDPVRCALDIERGLGSKADDPVRVLFKPTNRIKPELLAEFAKLDEAQQRQVFLTSVKLEETKRG